MSESQALQVVDAQPLARMENAPEIVLAEAQKAAAALKKVIQGKPKPVTINGETYLEFEDWQTVGRFYGYTAGAEEAPENTTFGCSVTDDSQSFLRSLAVMTPKASSWYESTTKPLRAAMPRNQSMWQLESAETRASSGSMALGSEYGVGTTCGDDEPATVRPPSKRSRCRRL